MSIRYGILGALTEESLHGYEIKRRVETLLGGSWDINIGQVYATLQRLERDGLVEPVGERCGRRKLTYQSTEAGRRRLMQWLTEPETEPHHVHEALFVKLLLLPRYASSQVDTLIARQRRVYAQRLCDLDALARQARQAGRDDVASLLKGAILHTNTDIAWMDTLLEAIPSRV
jgi:DNA-binding PadR family transcriptional regulator